MTRAMKKKNDTETQYRVKVAYQEQPAGPMEVRWFEYAKMPSKNTAITAAKAWAKSNEVKLISVQRHRIEFDNVYI